LNKATQAPYWRKILRSLNPQGRKIRNLEELRNIPVMTRAQMKDNKMEELIVNRAPSKRLLLASTSGSTGEPLTFYQDTRELYSRYITTLQELRYIGANPQSQVITIGLHTHRYLDWVGYRISGEDLESDQLRQRIIYPPLGKVKPTILISTPSLIHRLVHFLEEDKKESMFKKILYWSSRIWVKLQEIQKQVN